MLINKGVSPNEVVTIKTQAGEEIVAKLVEETGTHYKVSKPMVLTMGPQGVGMMPYMITVGPDTDVPLNKNNVMVVLPTDKSAADQYTQSVTGIKLV
jgi:hypothetical protein